MSNGIRIKGIIMDKSPTGNSLQMTIGLGYNNGNTQVLADAINLEFGTSLTSTDFDNQQTVGDAVTMVENAIGS